MPDKIRAAGRAAATPSPAMRYIRLVRKRLAVIRKDMPALIRMGERMAQPILDGGRLFPPGVAGYWPSEFSYRAGGLIALGAYNYTPKSDKDVAFFALPCNASWEPAKDAELQRLLKTKARLFVIGRREDLRGLKGYGRFAGFTGGVGRNEGLYEFGSIKPLAPLWPIDQLVRGWVTAGEMIGAFTRAEKMPAIWMSVWLEGAYARNSSFLKHDNLREPWYTPMFHENRYVPPLARGYAGGEFLGALHRVVAALEDQQDRLAKAGAWMAQAAKAQKRVSVVAVGHSYPKLLGLPEGAPYPVQWGRTNSDLSSALPAVERSTPTRKRSQA